MTDMPRICLVSASRENVFFTEILEAFGEALRSRGMTVERSVDCFPAPADDRVCLFIPHEYGGLVHELAYPTRAQLRRSVAVCTEQPGTNWFEFSLHFAGQAGAVVDINPLAVQELRRRGVEADHARLGYVEEWDVWQERHEAPRAIDLAFLGRYTDERARTISRCMPAVRDGRAAIYLTETVVPHTANSSYFLAGKKRAELLADTKVLLNVHQQKLPYLEWHRILSAVLNGCVVLTEHALHTAPFEPGVHFFSVRGEDMPHTVEALINDPDRLDRVRSAAYRLVRDELPMCATADVLLAAVERADCEPVQREGSPRPPSVPMPKAPDNRMPAWQQYAELPEQDLSVRGGLKDLLIRTRALEERVAELVTDEEGTPAVAVEELGPSVGCPKVSVILTVYNHADLVCEALRSVALADWRDLEVVAVDDGSSDGSAEAIRAASAEFPWLKVRLVRRAVNSGRPAVARNLAADHATGEMLFVLDSDNLVLPRGLNKLATTLDEDQDAAFSYGIIARFDYIGSQGLFSYLDWDSERLRYGNYIDAMAMIRASALQAVGGYPTEQTLAGWEDFGLWLAMADSGMYGVRVPDFVGQYRVNPYSMVSVANLDQSTIWTTLLRKYSCLHQSPNGGRAIGPGRLTAVA